MQFSDMYQILSVSRKYSLFSQKVKQNWQSDWQIKSKHGKPSKSEKMFCLCPNKPSNLQSLCENERAKRNDGGKTSEVRTSGMNTG